MNPQSRQNKSLCHFDFSRLLYFHFEKCFFQRQNQMLVPHYMITMAYSRIFGWKINIEVSKWFDHVVAWTNHEKENFQIALMLNHVVESVSLPNITKSRSKAFISGMTYHDDVIDDVTKQLLFIVIFDSFFHIRVQRMTMTMKMIASKRRIF